jgi:hypothetical protein
MIDLEEMPVVLDEGGMTVRCLEKDGGKYWAVTRTPEASAEAIARAMGMVPNPTGYRFDFPVNGKFTEEWFCAN